jgi:hypothetical protein
MRRAVEERRLRFFKAGAALRFRTDWLDTYIAANTVEPRRRRGR